MLLADKEQRTGTYRTAGWMVVNLGLSQSILLRMVANELVRVKRVDPARPLYSVNDVQRILEEMADDGMPRKTTGRRKKARGAK